MNLRLAATLVRTTYLGRGAARRVGQKHVDSIKPFLKWAC
jgi:hypothetical protein